MKINDYDKSTALADQYEEQLVLFYERVLNVIEVTYIRDKKQQLDGKDLKVDTIEGDEVYVDEKVRKDPWTDIALEEISNVNTGRPGWLTDGKGTDYICYAVVPLNLIYWLPFKELLATFKKRKALWEYHYGAKYPVNRGYKSKIIPVPPYELWACLVQDHDKLKDWEYEGGMLHRWNFITEA